MELRKFFPIFLLYMGLIVAFQWPSTVSGIILCDSDCINNTELDVCMKTLTQTALPVMGLFPCDVPEFRGRGLTVAAQMAVRQLQRNDSVLPNHRLELSVSNTMVRRFVS